MPTIIAEARTATGQCIQLERIETPTGPDQVFLSYNIIVDGEQVHRYLKAEEAAILLVTNQGVNNEDGNSKSDPNDHWAADGVPGP